MKCLCLTKLIEWDKCFVEWHILVDLLGKQKDYL